MEEYVKTELGLSDPDFDTAKDSLEKAGLVHYQCGNSDSCCPFSFTVKGAETARKVLMEQLFH
ncbi:MAG: hypothetical protein NTZ13_04365 [Candidatus Parcubacteria bacterium]|nr:hypothetical protein [Candidatus Parcubacteria bacterium]